MKTPFCLLATIFVAVCSSCFSPANKPGEPVASAYQDRPFLQDYSIKYYIEEDVELKKVFADRNNTLQVMTDQGLFRPHAGQFLYPGELIRDRTYLPMSDKNLSGMDLYQNQFIYLDDEAVFGNAWAGSVYIKHQLDQPGLVASGNRFDFLIADGQFLEYLSDSKSLWNGSLDEEILGLRFRPSGNGFWILTEGSLHTFSVTDQALEEVFTGKGFTCFEILDGGNRILIGTQDGYM